MRNADAVALTSGAGSVHAGRMDESTAPGPATNGRGERIDTVVHPLAVRIKELLTREGRFAAGLFIIDDDENIAQAIRGGVMLDSVYYAGEDRLSERTLRMLSPDVPVHEVAPRTCKKIFEKDRFSRVFALATTPPEPELGDLPSGDILILDGLAISGNIGSIIRSSLALGAAGLVLVNCDQVDRYDRRLIRASRGYIFSLPLVEALEEEVVEFLGERGVPLAVMDATAEAGIESLRLLATPAAIVLGSEKSGASAWLTDVAAHRISIPMTGGVESLNVSTTAGIVLFTRRYLSAVT